MRSLRDVEAGAPFQPDEDHHVPMVVRKAKEWRMAQLKAFTRGQTQVLYPHLPQVIFEHDDYGLCKVETVSLSEAGVNREALFDALTAALSRCWTNPRFADKFPDSRDPSTRVRYVIDEPREVRFVPYPLVFRCRCSRLIRRVSVQNRLTSAGQRQFAFSSHASMAVLHLTMPRRDSPQVSSKSWQCGRLRAWHRRDTGTRDRPHQRGSRVSLTFPKMRMTP